MQLFLRKQSAGLASAMLLSLLHLFWHTPLASAANKPNIILIMTDDQGYSDVGYNGHPHLQTPVLDTLAADSTVFNRTYAAPVCSPTRAGLMTGRYAYRTGVTDTQAGYSILRPEETTLAESLGNAGYRTGMFGKWHLGDNSPSRPIDQGFDRSLMHIAGMIGMPYNPQDGNSYFDPILLENGAEKRFKGYCVDIFTDAAIEFLRAPSDEPFFLFFTPNTPHHPLTVADSYAQPYRDMGLSEQTARYYGMITNIDHNVGRLLEALKELGAMDNTIIVFVGDNGTSSLHKQDDLWESGLRGRKSYIYENGIRVPMFIRLPKGPQAPKRIETPAIVEDLMPTMLDLVGVTPKADIAFDGRSLVPLIHESAIAWPTRSLFFQFHRGTPVRHRHIAVIRDPFKLVQPQGRGLEPFDAENIQYELYNLDEDPEEAHDIAPNHPEIVKELAREYDAWFDSVTVDGFEPVATWIGEELHEVVTLTRQDWLGAGLFDGDLGAYHLDVRTSGLYRITCRWGHLMSKTHPVTLRLKDQVMKREILYAESECRFDAVQLDKGPLRLEAWVEIDGVQSGFRYIQIERID